MFGFHLTGLVPIRLLYADKRLSEGEYLGQLYDIGFDRPEAHVIRKDGTLYYAFFAKHYNGSIELRGLDPGTYEILDYVHDRSLGRVQSPGATLRTRFDHSLLLEARPIAGL